MGSVSNSNTIDKGEQYAQALNIYFDILIDEERYKDVYDSVLFYDQNIWKRIIEEVENKIKSCTCQDRKNNRETKNCYICTIREALKSWEKYINSRDRTIFISATNNLFSATNKLYIHDQPPEERESCLPTDRLAIDQDWIPLFLVKCLRAWLQSWHNSDAYEALDELGSFLVGRVYMLKTNDSQECSSQKCPQNYPLRSQGYPDFEVLYYLESAACYKEELSIGFAQKALDKIQEYYLRKANCTGPNDERDPYELLAIYHKGLSLAHKKDTYFKEKAIDEFNQIIEVFGQPENNNQEVSQWQKKYKKQAEADGTDDLWEHYIYIPAILGKSEVLLDLQRSKECIDSLDEFSNFSRSNENKSNLPLKYKELRHTLLRNFAELDNGEIWPASKNVNFQDFESKVKLKLCSIAKAFELGIDNNGSLKETLEKIIKSLDEKNDYPSQKTLFKSFIVEVLKDLEELRLKKKEYISNYLLKALKISYNDFDTLKRDKDKFDKEEMAEKLKQWLETFEVFSNYLASQVISNQKNAIKIDIGDYLIGEESDKKYLFNFLVKINENIKSCKDRRGRLAYKDEIEKFTLSIFKELNDTKDLNMNLLALGTIWKNPQHENLQHESLCIYCLQYDLLEGECNFILEHYFKNINELKISEEQKLKLVRRLEQLLGKIINWKDIIKTIEQENINFKAIKDRKEKADQLVKEICNKLKDNRLQDYCLPKENFLGNTKEFSKRINRDYYLKIMRQNTEMFDDRLIYHSVRYSSDSKRLGNIYGLTVLRKWQSYTPSLAGGPVTSLGGGYFVYKTNNNGEVEEGIVIDPGFDFVENFFEQGFSIRDISAIIMTHDHIDHNADFRAIITLFNETNKRGKKRIHGWEDHKMLVFSTAGCFSRFAADIAEEEVRKLFKDTIVVSPKDSKPLDLLNNFIIKPVPAYHKDLSRMDCMGIIIEGRGGVPLIGFTGDTMWTKDLAKNYKYCPVMCINLGGVIDVRKEDCFEKVFANGESIKKLICKENHLYLPGFMLLSEELINEGYLQMIVISEIGEELKGGLREDLAQRVKDYFEKRMGYPDLCVLAEDIGLTISLPASRGGLRIKCDKCKEMILPHEIHTVTRTTARGVEQLYRYCNQCYQRYLRLTESEKRDF